MIIQMVSIQMTTNSYISVLMTEIYISFSGGMKNSFLIDNRYTDFHQNSFDYPVLSDSVKHSVKPDFSENSIQNDLFDLNDIDPATKMVFDILDLIFKRKKSKESIKRIEKEKEEGEEGEEGEKGEEMEKEKEKEVEFINPMVFDRLAIERGVFEIKYLFIFPLNSDPLLMSPEHGQIYSNRSG
jgi:hypothetical protein